MIPAQAEVLPKSLLLTAENLSSCPESIIAQRLETEVVIRLIPETKNALLLMVTIVVGILLLGLNGRIVIVMEHCITGFKNRTALAVNPRCVEQKCGACGSRDLNSLGRREGGDLFVTPHAGGILTVCSLDVVERASLDVSEIKRQFHFAGNIADGGLIIPGVAMPTMKHAAGRKRFPAFGFHQLIANGQAVLFQLGFHFLRLLGRGAVFVARVVVFIF